MTYKQFKKIKTLALIIFTIFIFSQNFRLILSTRNKLKIIENTRESYKFIENKSKYEEETNLDGFIVEKIRILNKDSWGFSQESDYNAKEQTISASRERSWLSEPFLMIKGLILRLKECFLLSLNSLKYRFILSENGLLKLRQKLVWLLEGNISSRGVTLAEGFLFGELSGASQELYQSFKVIGILHLIAASSANVYLLLHFFKTPILLFSKIGNKKLEFFISMLIIWLYFFLLNASFSLVEASASIFRAVLMVSLHLFGNLVVFRANSSAYTLLLVAILLLIINPFYLNDLAFQFSFLASFALLFIWPTILKKTAKARKNIIISNLLLSIVVQLVLAPIFVFRFSEINLLGIAANIVLAPLVEVLSAGYLYLLVISFLSPLGASFFAKLMQIIIDIFFYLLDIFNQIPFKSWIIYENKKLIGGAILLINFLIFFYIILDKNRLRKINKYRILNKWANWQ